MRSLAIALFVGVFLALVAQAHRYFAQRLILDVALADPLRSVGLAGLVAAGALLVLSPALSRRVPPRVGRLLAWPAYIWMGASFYLLLLLGVADLAHLLTGIDGISARRASALGVVASCVALVTLGMVSVARGPGVKRVDIPLRRWPSGLRGYRIVQISDIHIGPLLDRRFATKIVERVNALEPDLIAVTGDLVDGRVRELHTEVAPLSRLRAKDGVYFVTGNHDHYSGARDWARHVADRGMTVLRNRHVTIGDAGQCFHLAGVNDHSSGRFSRDGEALPRALSDRRPDHPTILLAHDPRTFEQARRHEVDLQLSGHTHGGQIWPFSWLVRLQTRFVAGLYSLGPAQLYVSRGTGVWGPPLRVFAPAEITEIVLA